MLWLVGSIMMISALMTVFWWTLSNDLERLQKKTVRCYCYQIIPPDRPDGLWRWTVWASDNMEISDSGVASNLENAKRLVRYAMHLLDDVAVFGNGDLEGEVWL